MDKTARDILFEMLLRYDVDQKTTPNITHTLKHLRRLLPKKKNASWNDCLKAVREVLK